MSDTIFAEQPTDDPPDLSGLSDEQLLAQLQKAPAQVEAPASVAATPSPAPAPAPAEPAAEVVPGEAAAAADEPVAEPAPAIDPASQRDPNKANNFRIQAQNAVEQQALELRKQDSTLSLADALAQSYEMLGLPSPFAVAPTAEPVKSAQEAPPAAVEDPLAKIQAEIASLTEQKKGLNKVIDADEVEVINDRLADLREERVRAEARQMIQEQQQAMQDEQIISSLEQQVQAEFPDLANPQHPLTMAYEAELKQLCATAPDHVLLDPQMELKLAQRIAQRFETEFQMPVKRASKPAATAPVAKPNTTVTQPAAAPAVAAPPAAVRPSSAAAPVVSTSASASPVMGIAPQNPQAAFEALLASDKPLGEEADALLLAARFGTAPAPAGTRFRAA